MHLGCVLEALKQAGLKANPDKCKFYISECEYVGHLINAEGLSPSPPKLDAILQLQPPQDVSQLRSFLGLTGYYRRFVWRYANVAAPLNELLQKDRPCIWTLACQAAFNTLKDAIVDDVILKRPDYNQPFLVQVDWSTNGLGAVLSQIHNGVERPSAFQSRSLRPAEKNYSPTEGEALAAVWGLLMFRPYIQGQKFKLETDCSALTWLKEHPDPPPKIARWLLKLSEFDFDIIHRKGKQNANADALSRLPIDDSEIPEDITDRPLLPGESFFCSGTFCLMDELDDEDSTERIGYCQKREKQQGLLAPLERGEEEAERSAASQASSVAPSVPADGTCLQCNQEGDPSKLLVCDCCNQMIHIDCLRPPLQEVPKGVWNCPICVNDAKDIQNDEPVLDYVRMGECDVPEGDNIARIRKRAKNYKITLGNLYKIGSVGSDQEQKLVPPKNERQDLIASCHAECGHYSVKRTESLLNKKYTWQGIRQDISKHIRDCLECKLHESKFNTDPALHSIPVIPTAWHSIGIDIGGPFPTTSEGHRYVIIATDYFTKWIEAKPLVDQISKETANFVKGIIESFGAMSVVRTDQGTHFKGAFQEFLEMNLVDHRLSRPYHPQSNGLVERSVQTISKALKKSVTGDERMVLTWSDRLPAVVRGYNMSTQASTKQSPFYLMHGWNPQVPLNTAEVRRTEQRTSAKRCLEALQENAKEQTIDLLNDDDPDYDQQLEKREAEIEKMHKKRKLAHSNIESAQEAQRKDYNKRRSIPEGIDLPQPAEKFKTGDLVLIRELNPNHVLKPGEKYGAKKLKGTIRGPYKYVGPRKGSQRYCTICDAAGQEWEKAFHDVIKYDDSRSVQSYKIADFLLPTNLARETESSWRST